MFHFLWAISSEINCSMFHFPIRVGWFPMKFNSNNFILCCNEKAPRHLKINLNMFVICSFTIKWWLHRAISYHIKRLLFYWCILYRFQLNNHLSCIYQLLKIKILLLLTQYLPDVTNCIKCIFLPCFCCFCLCKSQW